MRDEKYESAVKTIVKIQYNILSVLMDIFFLLH